MSAAALTLATYNTARISKLEMQIAQNNKRLDHLVDITSLHEQHFKALDKELDDVAEKLAQTFPGSSSTRGPSRNCSLRQ